MKRGVGFAILGALMVPVAAMRASATPPSRPVAVSTDPLNHWTVASLNPGAGFASGFTLPVASLAGKFFASGAPAGLNSVGIDTSAAGLSWGQSAIVTLPSPTSLPPYAMPLLALGEIDGTYVAGFGNGMIMTSRDGASWSFTNSTTNQGLTSVACATVAAPPVAGTLREVHPVCVFGSNGFVVTSTDKTLQSWKTAGLPDERYGVAGVAYGDGVFVAVTQTGCAGCGASLETGAIYTSPDGLTWTQRTATSGLFSVTYGATKGFVAVGWMGTVMTSTDGITWAKVLVPNANPSAIQLHGVAYGNGDYVAVGFIQSTPPVPVVYSNSRPSTVWVAREINVPNSSLYSVAFGNNRFVLDGFAVGYPSPGHMAVTSDPVPVPSLTLAP